MRFTLLLAGALVASADHDNILGEIQRSVAKAKEHNRAKTLQPEATVEVGNTKEIPFITKSKAIARVADVSRPAVSYSQWNGKSPLEQFEARKKANSSTSASVAETFESFLTEVGLADGQAYSDQAAAKLTSWILRRNPEYSLNIPSLKRSLKKAAESGQFREVIRAQLEHAGIPIPEDKVGEEEEPPVPPAKSLRAILEELDWSEATLVDQPAKFAAIVNAHLPDANWTTERAEQAMEEAKRKAIEQAPENPADFKKILVREFLTLAHIPFTE